MACKTRLFDYLLSRDIALSCNISGFSLVICLNGNFIIQHILIATSEHYYYIYFSSFFVATSHAAAIMGNSLTHAVHRGSTAFSNNSNNHTRKSRASTTPRNQKSRYHSTLCDNGDGGEPQRKAKTLPARHSRRRSEHTTNDIHGHGRSKTPPASAPPNGETSRMLFLLYLIHRTWNVVVETVDTRSKR